MNEEHENLVKTSVSELMRGASSMPVYRPDIQNASDVCDIEDLPLIYIWGEDRRRGSFQMGVNPWIVEAHLATVLPKTDANFDEVRNRVGQTIFNFAQQMIFQLMKEEKAYPSRLFAAQEH